jgi:hypothetical protein
MFLLLTAGCAECRWGDDPLIEARGPFETREEAQAASWLRDRPWADHPQGGWYARDGQGDHWVLPVPDGVLVREVG